MNGRVGSPGIRAKPKSTTATIAMARGWKKIWEVISAPMLDSLPARLTMMPVAVDTISAGIWATRPSPTVSRV